MKQILGNIMENKQELENKSINKEELVIEKQRIEDKIRRLEKREIDNRVIDSLRKLQDLNESISDIQNSLNLAWKRTQQVQEELKQILNI